MAATKKKKFGPLKELPQDVQDRMDASLLAGDSPYDVARWLNEELGLIQTHSIDALRKMLERYRGSELRERTLARIANVAGASATKTLMQRLNSMEEIEDLVRTQKGRVEKLLLREVSMPSGILLKDTQGEMRLLKELLIDLGKMQLETGVLVRAPRNAAAAGLATPGDISETDASWTEEQEQLFNQLSHALGDENAGS